jgi:cation diffusion facilitator CzcD-associated flavoprotein CzcO
MAEPTHLDVLVVGAGLSGIGAGYHLQTHCPRKTYAILEARESLGGTWDLFRYPGVRSDSDMYTLGYSFRPWTDPKAIADGPSILSYVRETAEAFGIDRKIRYGHRVTRASWSKGAARWTVEVQRVGDAASAETVTLTCSFLFMCAGYYDYDAGYTPDLPGRDRFRGRVVHPQHWPQDLDYAGKRVVVIGSGATAVTLVPAMSETAAHVTMLQRSPTYIVTAPSKDAIANWLREHLPNESAYAITRWKNVLYGMVTFALCRRYPEGMKRYLVGKVKKQVSPAVDVERDFTPRYNPWDQRVCLVPDGDLFKALEQGRASVITDTIETFTETGIQLHSGRELAADVIVTATGLSLRFLGGLGLQIDGQTVTPQDTMIYKGMMLSGVPNLAFAIGYTNASWTLKCDLTCEYVCRLLNTMDARGFTQCCPRRDPKVQEAPLLDFTSGYVQRGLDRVPRQGSAMPWKLYQNYVLDRLTLRRGRVADGALELTR